MAFWKKSDDPWDRKPGKQKKAETAWWEQDPVVTEPVETAAETVEKSVESVENTEKRGMESCPWCGGEMVSGRLSSGRDGIYWREGAEPERLLEFLMEGGERLRPDRAWRCRGCGRVVFTLQGSGTLWEEKTSFHEYVDQWNAMEEQERRSKKES